MTFDKKIQFNEGLTLIEILVGLALVSFIYLALPSSEENISRRKLQSTIDSFDRATRFANNEAILRNTIVRLRLMLDTEPIEYAVEYGPTEKFQLPKYEDISKLSLKEQERYADIVKNVNQQFHKVTEFKSFNKAIEDEVRILGVSSSLYPDLQLGAEASIYFYPSGERDSALIICNHDEEIATLEIQPFTEKNIDRYLEVDFVDGIDIEDKLYDKSREIYNEWIKEKK